MYNLTYLRILQRLGLVLFTYSDNICAELAELADYIIVTAVNVNYIFN